MASTVQTKVNRKKKIQIQMKNEAIRNPMELVTHKIMAMVPLTLRLPQFVDFLYQFEQKKALHRITVFRLNPKDDNLAGRRANGRFGIELTIEAIFLPDAEKETALPEGEIARFDKSLEDYKSMIVKRNIFGPPNEKPALNSISPPVFEPGQPIRIPIMATDDGQELKYELVSSSTKDAEIRQAAGSSSATFISPGLEEEGRYRYEVKASDSGFPSKFDSQQFVVRVQKKKEDTPVVVETVPDADLTMITALTRNAKRQNEIWIYIQSQGLEKTVKVGETFKLDGKTWLLRSHNFEYCLIECDGKLLKYEQGDRLSKPQSSTSLLAQDDSSDDSSDQ